MWRHNWCVKLIRIHLSLLRGYSVSRRFLFSVMPVIKSWLSSSHVRCMLLNWNHCSWHLTRYKNNFFIFFIIVFLFSFQLQFLFYKVQNSWSKGTYYVLSALKLSYLCTPPIKHNLNMSIKQFPPFLKFTKYSPKYSYDSVSAYSHKETLHTAIFLTSVT